MAKFKNIAIFVLTLLMLFGICVMSAGCLGGDRIKDAEQQIEELKNQISGQTEKIAELEQENKNLSDRIKDLELKTSDKSFYTLQEAYYCEFLTKEDLLSIAYYHHSQAVNPNIGMELNSELMGENYQPIKKTPETLNADRELVIRQAFINKLNKVFSSTDFSLDNVKICAYYGTYNGGTLIRFLYAEGEYIALNGQSVIDVVADVKFHYPNYTGFFSTDTFRFNNAIMYWKEN